MSAYLSHLSSFALLFPFSYNKNVLHFSREGQSRAKVLSNMVKQKRKEKAVSKCCVVIDGVCLHGGLCRENGLFLYRK